MIVSTTKVSLLALDVREVCKRYVFATSPTAHVDDDARKKKFTATSAGLPLQRRSLTSQMPVSGPLAEIQILVNRRCRDDQDCLSATETVWLVRE
jgi:hypothetical protein